jgi:hypothetical protein
MIRSNLSTASPTAVLQPTLGRRVLRMAAVWAVLGAIMGASVGMARGGIVGAIAGMIGGMLELAALGAIFATVGGRPDESVLGALVGLLAGLAFGLVTVHAPAVLVANFGMVVGAIAGATLRAYLRLLAGSFFTLVALVFRPQRPSGAGPLSSLRGPRRPAMGSRPVQSTRSGE